VFLAGQPVGEDHQPGDQDADRRAHGRRWFRRPDRLMHRPHQCRPLARPAALAQLQPATMGTTRQLEASVVPADDLSNAVRQAATDTSSRLWIPKEGQEGR